MNRQVRGWESLDESGASRLMYAARCAAEKSAMHGVELRQQYAARCAVWKIGGQTGTILMVCAAKCAA